MPDYIFINLTQTVVLERSDDALSTEQILNTRWYDSAVKMALEVTIENLNNIALVRKLTSRLCQQIILVVDGTVLSHANLHNVSTIMMFLRKIAKFYVKLPVSIWIRDNIINPKLSCKIIDLTTDYKQACREYVIYLEQSLLHVLNVPLVTLDTEQYIVSGDGIDARSALVDSDSLQSSTQQCNSNVKLGEYTTLCKQVQQIIAVLQYVEQNILDPLAVLPKIRLNMLLTAKQYTDLDNSLYTDVDYSNFRLVLKRRALYVVATVGIVGGIFCCVIRDINYVANYTMRYDITDQAIERNFKNSLQKRFTIFPASMHVHMLHQRITRILPPPVVERAEPVVNVNHDVNKDMHKDVIADISFNYIRELLFDKNLTDDNNRYHTQPMVVTMRPCTLDDHSDLEYSNKEFVIMNYLKTQHGSLYGIEGKPMWQKMINNWWKNEDITIGVKTNLNHNFTIAAASGQWAMLHLLKLAKIVEKNHILTATWKNVYSVCYEISYNPLALMKFS